MGTKRITKLGNGLYGVTEWTGNRKTAIRYFRNRGIKRARIVATEKRGSETAVFFRKARAKPKPRGWL